MNKFENKIAKIPVNPLEYNAKMGFQRYIMKKELGENPNSAKVLEWIDANAREISDLLDNEENKEIREFVISGDFEKAYGLLEKIIKNSSPAKAA